MHYVYTRPGRSQAIPKETTTRKSRIIHLVFLPSILLLLSVISIRTSILLTKSTPYHDESSSAIPKRSSRCVHVLGPSSGQYKAGIYVEETIPSLIAEMLAMKHYFLPCLLLAGSYFSFQILRELISIRADLREPIPCRSTKTSSSRTIAALCLAP